MNLLEQLGRIRDAYNKGLTHLTQHLLVDLIAAVERGEVHCDCEDDSCPVFKRGIRRVIDNLGDYRPQGAP